MAQNRKLKIKWCVYDNGSFAKAEHGPWDLCIHKAVPRNGEEDWDDEEAYRVPRWTPPEYPFSISVHHRTKIVPQKTGKAKGPQQARKIAQQLLEEMLNKHE